MSEYLGYCECHSWLNGGTVELSIVNTTSAAVAVDSSHTTASSSASWSRFSPPSDFVNGHVSTTLFMVCRWPQSQDWTRPHLCKLAWHRPLPVRLRDHVWRGKWKPGCRLVRSVPAQNAYAWRARPVHSRVRRRSRTWAAPCTARAHGAVVSVDSPAPSLARCRYLDQSRRLPRTPHRMCRSDRRRCCRRTRYDTCKISDRPTKLVDWQATTSIVSYHNLFAHNSKFPTSVPSVLRCCWLGGRNGIRPARNWECWGAGMVVVWSKVQTCTWPSWCHCHSLSLASVKSILV